MPSDQIGAALVLAVSALTPGPNNVIVLEAGARGGLRAALPAIAGILAGTMALVALVAAGVSAQPALRQAVAIGGSLYLCWLGASLIVRNRQALEHAPRRPAGFFALFGFQFVNPKSWLMVLTVASALEPGPSLFLLFTLIPVACLLLWAVAGALLMRSLQRRSMRVWFDRAMGALLILAALLLVVRP